MTFDHQGRRREYLEVAANGMTNSLKHFTYDNYVCIARNRWQQDGTFVADRFTWDPTEPVATRPLVFYQPNAPPQFYAIDGNKNVSELVSSADGSISAHYEYAPFGEVILLSGESATKNPWRFSSEYMDDAIVLYYYNCRHLSCLIGRWISRDKGNEDNSVNLYGFLDNNGISRFDLIGMVAVIIEKPLVFVDRINHKGTRARTIHLPTKITFHCEGLFPTRLRVMGVATRIIEILNKSNSAWNKRYRRYNAKWGVPRDSSVEWSAAYAHEYDHYQAWNDFFEFARTANTLDGKSFGLFGKSCCEELADELFNKHNKLFTEAIRHSARYDLDEYRYGGRIRRREPIN